MDNEKLKELLKFLINRKITNLYKQFFFTLEDLKLNGANISTAQYQQIRKKILDLGNDAIREIEENLEKFDIKIK